MDAHEFMALSMRTLKTEGTRSRRPMRLAAYMSEGGSLVVTKTYYNRAGKVAMSQTVRLFADELDAVMAFVQQRRARHAERAL